MSHQDPHSQAADAVHEGRPVEAQYTKQGKGGQRISAEMAIAIGLTLIGLVVVYLFFSGAFSRSNDRSNDGAAAYSSETTTPQPDGPTTSTGQPGAPA